MARTLLKSLVMLHSSALRTALALLAVVAATTCGGEPLPEPPMARPDPVDPDRLGPSEESSDEQVDGREGAAPRESEVVGINLETDAAPVRASASGDGSFSLVLAHGAGDELRLWTEAEGRRSTPLDLLALGTGGPFVVNAPNPCLSIAPELVVEPGENTLMLGNVCASDATVMDVRVRRASPGLDVPEPPPTIPAGAEVSLSVVVDDAESIDDTLLLDIEFEAQRERYAISVYGD